jgi:phage FluMu protein Com
MQTPKTYRCPHCQQGFSYFHKAGHPSVPSLKCPACFRVFAILTREPEKTRDRDRSDHIHTVAS